MVEIPALWHSATRKEAMDLIQILWPALDDAGRSVLSDAIVAGPPESLLARVDEVERTMSRDRRIYDRLIVVERVREPALSPVLADELARIRQMYPEWQPMPGEKAHFGSWVESRWGPDTRYGIDELSAFDDATLIDLLNNEEQQREGLLDVWRRLAAADGERALSVLDLLADRGEEGRADVWRYGLWGLRDNAKSGFVDRLLVLLSRIPASLFIHADFSQAVAEIVQAVSGAASSSTLAPSFWKLFDRAIAAAAVDPVNIAGEDRNDWVSFAINCSMGHLAQGFFSALFARGLKVGDGIPADLAPRLDRLVSPFALAHRPARVIAASRLSYLYAIDPTWVEQTLLPGFSWQDEDEALALWQGFGWQARIDPQLWTAIKSSFLDLFMPERLARFGGFRRNLAQLLMVAGIEFGVEELPRERVRAAVRAMPDDMRRDAIGWVATYLQRKQADDTEEGEGGDDSLAPSDVDLLWRERVGPWLKRVWPSDPSVRSQAISEQMAVAAVATDQAFPEAVALIGPYLVRSDAFYFLHHLMGSEHPEDHPRAVVALIEKVLDAEMLRWANTDLRAVLDRALAADPTLAADAAFRRWDQRLRVLES